ncbi:CHY zinc finger protein [Virgibacillus xinjiangensis]|uniref:CHY zinc finger protein n=1 Tax=Virgibacillus xinjiangensis TaxID=393090 RepID=A0ABV7CT94_9BACI
MRVHGKEVVGAVDQETRCSHYHTEIDRIAIKFYCCGQYFPCYQCHEEYGCGKKQVWPRQMFDQKAVLCGGCGEELSINEYLGCQNRCPYCRTSFNPGCSFHYHLYFEKNR